MQGKADAFEGMGAVGRGIAAALGTAAAEGRPAEQARRAIVAVHLVHFQQGRRYFLRVSGLGSNGGRRGGGCHG